LWRGGGQRVYIHPKSMPNQRDPNQKLVPIPMKQEFIDEIDAAMIKSGYDNRSKFIRDAIIEKLRREGHPVPAELAAAPLRTGRGVSYGRPPESSAYALNEKADTASSTVDRAAKALAKTAASKVSTGAPTRSRKRKADAPTE
jgi:Arc/MetJ-type ribon-helix-helix transcriptional regulator